MRHGVNGFGTILHEMMHQFGAYDLYPVHDSGYSGAWKGIGVWDIMASGNWNGGGDTPSLPTGPTMEAIGHVATQDVVLEWPDSAVGPCIGPSIGLDSRFAGETESESHSLKTSIYGLRNGRKKAMTNHFLVKACLSYSRINQQVILLTMH